MGSEGRGGRAAHAALPSAPAELRGCSRAASGIRKDYLILLPAFLLTSLRPAFFVTSRLPAFL
jgi:hypothetical protein